MQKPISRKPPLTLLAVALVLGAVGGFFLAQSFDELLGEVQQSPATFVTELDEGGHRVWEAIGSTRRAGGTTVSQSTPRRIGPADVSINEVSSGAAIAVSQTTFTETLNFGSTTYVAAASFEIDTPGQYEVRVTGEPTTFAVGRSFGFLFSGSRLASVLASAAAGILFVISIVWLIIRWGRQSKAKTSEAQASRHLPPPLTPSSHTSGPPPPREGTPQLPPPVPPAG